MTADFSQPAIVDKTRRTFIFTALNIWGDRDVTWTDGRTMREKDLARALGVQFTPTILSFDESAKVIARLDGYYPPSQSEAVLDYLRRPGLPHRRLCAAHGWRSCETLSFDPATSTHPDT